MFPSILDFAEIGDFIEAPLRTYSTGMVARLGFSVATCMRPDILLVDEVLSVGDSRFQEKCLDRMNSFQVEGTTIVIVSHSMQTIQNFCSRALWIEQGQPGAIGAVSEVISSYTSSEQASTHGNRKREHLPPVKRTWFKRLRYWLIPANSKQEAELWKMVKCPRRQLQRCRAWGSAPPPVSNICTLYPLAATARLLPVVLPAGQQPGNPLHHSRATAPGIQVEKIVRERESTDKTGYP